MSLTETAKIVDEIKKMDARRLGSGAWSVLPHTTDSTVADDVLDRVREMTKMAKIDKRVNVRVATIIGEDGSVEVNMPMEAPGWVRKRAEGRARNQAGAMKVALRLQRKLLERQALKELGLEEQ